MAGGGATAEKGALGDRHVGGLTRAGANPRACYETPEEMAVMATRLQGRGTRNDCGRTVPGSSTPDTYDITRRTVRRSRAGVGRDLRNYGEAVIT
jgi:hypothetical protein